MKKNKPLVPLSKCSVKKQAFLLSGNGNWETHSLPECGIDSIVMHDGPCGLRVPSDDINDLSHDGVAKATCFPAPSLSACSWDPSLFFEFGTAMAKEAREKGTDIVLAPGINIKRNPLCGRNFEYYSEDPLLSGELGASFINGLQSKGVGASLKHFAANNCEYHRFTISSEVDMRALREIYLKGFEIAIKKSNPWTVMCSYNRVNGVYASQNEWLLDKVLRKDWNYEGVVLSDWGAVLDPILAHSRGLDIEMPSFEKTRPSKIALGVRKGLIPKERFEVSVHRVASLEEKVKSAKSNANPEDFKHIDSHEIAKKIALNSIVLAKNDNVLPLKSLKGVCVIGAFAKTPRFQGDGSAYINPENLTNCYDELVKAAGKEIPFAPGYDLSSEDDDENLRIDAVDLASTSKTVLLFLGTEEGTESEGYDRLDMRLPERQIRLFEAIAAQNENIVLILSSGAPVEIPFVSKCKAVLLSYFAGEAGGEALKSILLGESNPSGHLSESWPIHYIDCPSALFYPGDGDVSLYKESVFVGYRYYTTAKREVLFPFGYGLSYTDFSLTAFKVSRETLREGKNAKVSVKVTNVGKVPGATVVQLYVGAKSPKTIHPLRELRRFEKVYLEPKKSKVVTFELTYEDFAHYGVNSDAWVVNDDAYSIEIGLNCRDISFSKDISVHSGHRSRDMRFLVPDYFHLPLNGAWRVGDDAFEILLDHSVSKNIRKKKRPYRRNSTFRDIEGTFIGKKLKKKVLEFASSKSLPKQAYEQNFNSMMDMPLRHVLSLGYSEKQLNAIIALANRKPLSALLHLIFG